MTQTPPPSPDPGATLPPPDSSLSNSPSPDSPPSAVPAASFPAAASLPPAAGAFQTGDLAAGRFRIVRFIARGGMGEVYEAEDLELRARVALKTIRPEIARNPQALERFKREIQLARQVTHPNICRVFDFWQHPPSIAFVTMELLRGETLAERLWRAGKFSETEALPLVQQMAAGLGAAHQAGVIHRDFKSGNVILVPSPRTEDPPRVVVTDFCIAQGQEASSNDDERWAGTPDYMAPEQVEGGEITPAADIYALGVLMYEMVTGVVPFSAETAHATAVARLAERAKPPRVLVPHLNARWEAAILRCMERDPAARFETAGDVLTALVGRETARASRSVAILEFRNRTGSSSSAWVATALAEALAVELSAGDGLRTVPGEDVARMVLECGLERAADE